MSKTAEREIAALMAEVRQAEEAARLDGFETCEGLVAEMLEAMAQAEAGKASTAYHAYIRAEMGEVFDAKDRHVRHEARAAALREAALAVRLGQARRAEKE